MLSGRGRRRKVSSALKRGLSKMQKLAAADAEQLLANSPAGDALMAMASVTVNLDMEGYVSFFGVSKYLKLKLNPSQIYFVAEVTLFLGFIGRFEVQVTLPFAELKKLKKKKGKAKKEGMMKALSSSKIAFVYSLISYPWDPIRQGKLRKHPTKGLNSLIPRVIAIFKKRITGMFSAANAKLTAIKKQLGITEESYRQLLEEAELGETTSATWGGKEVATRRRRWSAFRVSTTHKTTRRRRSFHLSGHVTGTAQDGADKAKEVAEKAKEKFKELSAAPMKLLNLAKAAKLWIDRARDPGVPPQHQPVWLCGGWVRGHVGAKVPPMVEVNIQMLLNGRRSNFMVRMDTGSMDRTADSVAQSLWPAVKNLFLSRGFGNDKCRFPLPVVTSANAKSQKKPKVPRALPDPDSLTKLNKKPKGKKGNVMRELASLPSERKGPRTENAEPAHNFPATQKSSIYVLGFNAGYGQSDPRASKMKLSKLTPEAYSAFEAGFVEGRLAKRKGVPAASQR